MLNVSPLFTTLFHSPLAHSTAISLSSSRAFLAPSARARAKRPRPDVDLDDDDEPRAAFPSPLTDPPSELPDVVDLDPNARAFEAAVKGKRKPKKQPTTNPAAVAGPAGGTRASTKNVPAPAQLPESKPAAASSSKQRKSKPNPAAGALNVSARGVVIPNKK